MAGGGVAMTPNTNLRSQTAKVSLYVWWCAISCGCGGLLLGYDIGIIGGVFAMPIFEAKFFPEVYAATHTEHKTSSSAYCTYNNERMALITSVLYLAALVGALAFGFVIRKFGRRVPLAVAGAFFIAGSLLMGFASNVGMLIGGRVLLGFGVAGACLITPVYIVEIAPPQLRGAMNLMFQLTVTLGIFVAGLLNWKFSDMKHGWQLSLGLGAVPGLIVALGGVFLPESPNSLMERNQPELALKNLAKLRSSPVDDPSVAAEFADIQDAANDAARANLSLWGFITRPEYRPQLFWSVVFMCCQQFTGMNAIMFYSSVLFSSLGSGHNSALLSTVIIGSVNVLATFFGIFAVDKLGRKLLLLMGGSLMIAMEIVVAVLIKTEFAKYGAKLPSTPSIIILVMICVYVTGFAFSWGPVGWLYPTEIQPLESRAIGTSFSVFSNMLFTFVIGQSFPHMLCKMEWAVFLFYACCLVGMVTLVATLAVETKGIPIEDVCRKFGNHRAWKKVMGDAKLHAGLPEQSMSVPDPKLGQPAGSLTQ